MTIWGVYYYEVLSPTPCIFDEIIEEAGISKHSAPE